MTEQNPRNVEQVDDTINTTVEPADAPAGSEQETKQAEKRAEQAEKKEAKQAEQEAKKAEHK